MMTLKRLMMMKRDMGVQRVREVVGTETALACGLLRSVRKNKA
jgi:hypothetical protein